MGENEATFKPAPRTKPPTTRPQTRPTPTRPPPTRPPPTRPPQTRPPPPPPTRPPPPPPTRPPPTRASDVREPKSQNVLPAAQTVTRQFNQFPNFQSHQTKSSDVERPCIYKNRLNRLVIFRSTYKL